MVDGAKEKLRELQQRTYREMVKQLKEFGMCNLVRPTGFGKTRMFMQYAMRHKSEDFLYVHDVESAKEDIINKYHPTNVKFITYSSISRLSSRDDTEYYFIEGGWYCVIFDEAHLMGGDNIDKVMTYVIPRLLDRGTKVLGGTATPLRTDGVNVTDKFFSGHEVFKYNLADAITDGIMVEPIWTVAVAQKELMQAVYTNNVRNRVTVQLIETLKRAYTNVAGIEACYRSTVEKAFNGEPPRYMQFIAFYPTIKSMKDNMDKLAAQMGRAFPEYTVRTFAISSDPEHFSDIVEIEKEAQTRKRCIDILFAVQMLNQGYHSNKLTGVILNRATLSNIVFTQQIGRCLSVTQRNKTIIFDNVGNAFITPNAVLNFINSQAKRKEYKKRARGGVAEEYEEVQLECAPKVLEFMEWYGRVKDAVDITDEQVAYAKRCLEEFGMPYKAIEHYVGVPRWLVDSEMPSEGGEQA